MRNVLKFFLSLRAFSIVLLLAATAVLVPAQSPVIEPCPATPTEKPNIIIARTAPEKIKEKASQTLIDSSVTDDPKMLELLSPYVARVKELSTVIGALDTALVKRNAGAGTIGQLVTTAMLSEARKKGIQNVAVAVMNAGGLRKNDIAAGQLHVSDIFELLPFENALITIDLTGEQLLKILQLSTRDAQAGARIEFKWNDQNRMEFLGAKLLTANRTSTNIDPTSTYTIVTIDYLYKLNSGAYAILKEGKNINWLNITIRDAVLDYVKSETAAGRRIAGESDGRYVQIGPGPANPGNSPND